VFLTPAARAAHSRRSPRGDSASHCDQPVRSSLLPAVTMPGCRSRVLVVVCALLLALQLVAAGDSTVAPPLVRLVRSVFATPRL